MSQAKFTVAVAGSETDIQAVSLHKPKRLTIANFIPNDDPKSISLD